MIASLRAYRWLLRSRWSAAWCSNYEPLRILVKSATRKTLRRAAILFRALRQPRAEPALSVIRRPARFRRSADRLRRRRSRPDSRKARAGIDPRIRPAFGTPERTALSTAV